MRLDQQVRMLRSKNVSPFVTTVDIYFNNDEDYRRFLASDHVKPEKIAELCRITPEEVLGVHSVDIVRGVKISMLKPAGMACGQVGCRDYVGAAQQIPFLSVDF